ncbi:MAG: lysophospholipid acyltransferase family protein [Sphaerochaetaceae bacterium]
MRIFVAAVVVVPALLLSVVVAIIPAGVMKLFRCRKAADRWMRLNGTFLAKLILFMLNVKVHVDGLENLPPEGTPVCFMANHQSLLDVPTVIGPLGIWAGFITKKELKKVPVVNFWVQSINCIYIDRKSPRSSIEAILNGVKNIKNGIPMFIFPEGTRSKTGRLGEFKNGSLKLATRAKAVIVPISIKGLRPALEGIRNLRRVHAYVSVCPPLPTADLNDEQLKDLHNVVYGEIASRFAQLPEPNA